MQNLSLIKPSYIPSPNLTQSIFFFFFCPLPSSPFWNYWSNSTGISTYSASGEIKELRLIYYSHGVGVSKIVILFRFLLYREMSDIDIDNNKWFCKGRENEFSKSERTIKNTGYLILFEFFHIFTVLLFNTW